MKKIFTFLLVLVLSLSMMTGCGQQKEQVIIYTSTNDDVIAHMTQALETEFPEYDIIIEYLPTTKHAAKILAEGVNTECDIIHDLTYENLDMLNNNSLLADLSGYDTSIYVDGVVVSSNYLPEIKCGGSIIVNTEMLTERNLPVPQSYEDLLKAEYKDLIIMPDPKASGTGYIFVKSLVNAWGEEAAFEYFDKLADNVFQFTSSSSGAVNSVAQKEAAITLSLTSQAVMAINDGAPLDMLFFEEGSPYCMYGQTIVKGKETRECVKNVFDYLINEYNQVHCEVFYPEQLYKGVSMEVENFPTGIVYADMSNSTLAEKERLLEKWVH